MADFATAFDDSPSLLICGQRKKWRRCAHCGRRTFHLCDWRMLKTRPTKVCRLQPGMPVKGYEHNFLPLDGVILSVRPLNREDFQGFSDKGWIVYRGAFKRQIEIEVEYYGNRPQPASKRPVLIIRPHVKDRLPIIRPGRCSKPCCVRCRRTVAPGVDYCQDHWL
jgi:hypothetical protein